MGEWLTSGAFPVNQLQRNQEKGMRVSKTFFWPSSLVAGLALSSHRRALRGLRLPPLAEGFCEHYGRDHRARPTTTSATVGSDGTVFESFGSRHGLRNWRSGHHRPVRHAPADQRQPQRKEDRRETGLVGRRCGRSGALAAPATFDSGDLPIEECSVSGSVNTSKATGSVSVSCSGLSAFAGLTVDELGSVQAAFNKAKNIKFSVKSNGKWSFKVTCKGAASLP